MNEVLGTFKNQLNTLAVSGDRVFFTEQGEGLTAGMPAVFLRLHYCNLNCRWCDTPYTWNKNMPEFHSEREQWSLEETSRNIHESWRNGITTYPNRSAVPRLVISGGEPLLQHKRIAELIRRPEFRGWEIEIETNGTILVPGDFPKEVQFNCSPKLSNSGIPAERRIRREVLQSMAENNNVVFKFVVETIADIDEILRDYLPIIPDLPRNRIYIMPQGTNVESIDTIRENMRMRVEKEGFVLGDRQHIRKHGNKRRT